MGPEQLAEKIAHSRARRNPSWATLAGLRGHDHALRGASRASYDAEAVEVDALLREAKDLPASLAREALVGLLSLESFELREVRTWARDPDVASQLFDHLFHVMIAGHLSPKEKEAALAARVAAAPVFLREARARFDPADVPPLWVGGALQTAAAAPAFLEALAEFHVPTDALRAALDEHAVWLADLHTRARGSPALGIERFRRLLLLRMIPESPDELEKMGEALRVRFARAMDEAARTVIAEAGEREASDIMAQALKIVRRDHGTSFAEVLADYEVAIVEARDLVVARGIATPTTIPLDVVETPAFLRHLVPFAAYVGPARFAAQRRGTYLVTPKADLSAFARADVRTTTVHEAWPGHHLQLSIAAEKAPLWAWLADAVDSVEGWALYCEAMMGEHGHTSRPAERFMREKDARWRALRIVLDVGLHARGLDPGEAAATLARETGMSAEEADAEVLRYTQAPAYNLSYMYGRIHLEALRAAWLHEGGTERGFHDAVLSAGPLPISLLRASLSQSRTSDNLKRRIS